ncbi:MAG: response regulator, partial [Ktedonobacterales bacterium]
ADDDYGLRESLQALFELAGYDVRVARDGVEALRALEEREPDLLVLDLMMPRMNGQGVVQEMERRQLRPRIPVLILSASGDAQTDAEQLHADGVVCKPFDIDVVLDAAQRLVG